MAVNNSLSSLQQGTLAAPLVGNAVTQTISKRYDYGYE